IGRFLAETAGFAAIPSLLAWAELDGAASAGAATLSILQAFVSNEGDGWSWVLERLSRVAAPGHDGTEALGEATSWLSRLGRRTAEMHIAFAIDTNDPAFRPEPVQADDLYGWAAAAQAMARRALDSLAKAGAQLEPEARSLTDVLLARGDAVLERIRAMAGHTPTFAKTRHHGDYHLGQVLVTGGDAVIVD